MNILICDNEKYCRIIKEYIITNAGEDGGNEIHTFKTADDIFSFCPKNKPDVLFTDIELDGVTNGIALAKRLKKDFPDLILVYITGDAAYVYSCFETEPLGFLGKPLSKEDFDKTFSRIINRYTQTHKYLTVKHQNSLVNLQIDDICYVEGYNRRLTFKMADGSSYETAGKVSDIFAKLQIYNFIRAHQGFIVNMAHIKDLRRNAINMQNGDNIPISNRRNKKTKADYAAFLGKTKV